MLPSLEAILVLLCGHLPTHIKEVLPFSSHSHLPSASKWPCHCTVCRVSLRKRLSQDEMANCRNRGQPEDRGLYHVPPWAKFTFSVNIAQAITYSQSSSSTQHLVILARSQLHTTGHSQLDTMEANPQRSSQPIQEPGVYLMKGLNHSKPESHRTLTTGQQHLMTSVWRSTEFNRPMFTTTETHK